jgi:dephospho-CoA kinase
MGAGTSLLYSSLDQNICGIVCDSPYARLRDLVETFGDFVLEENENKEKIREEVFRNVKELTGLVIEF